MSDVFLSYASADRERAVAIAELLRLSGYSVWWDRTIPPGRVFDEVLQEALGTAGCIVVLWSRASVASNWVKTEAAEGATRQILVPAILEDVPIPIRVPTHSSGEPSRLDRRSGRSRIPALDAVDRAAVAQRCPRRRAPTRRARTWKCRGSNTSRQLPRDGKAGVDPALVAASFLMGWVFSRTGAAPASDSAAEGMPADRPVVPNVSFGNSTAKAVAPSGTVSTDRVRRKVNLLAQENGGYLVVGSE